MERPRSLKLCVASLALVFVAVVLGCMHLGGFSYATGADMGGICDAHMSVAEAQPCNEMAFLLLAIVLAGLLSLQRPMPVLLSPTVVLWYLYDLVTWRIGVAVFCPIREAFRKGIIHPKLYAHATAPAAWQHVLRLTHSI